MTAPDSIVADFRRYAQLIEAQLIDQAFAPRAESGTAVQVERGMVLPRALRGSENRADDVVDRLIELAVVDASDHFRAVYRPLLVYAWLVAFRVRYETLAQSEFGRWDEALRGWCDVLEAQLGRAALSEALSDAQIPASRGDAATEAAWTALALHVAGKIFIRDAWTDLAADTFGRIARAQQPGGAFLLAGASDNPEPLWYHELVLLHAAASYAVQAEDRTLARAVARATDFHLRETQPDHATSQPWGLFAFIWNSSVRSMADQILHAVSLTGRCAILPAAIHVAAEPASRLCRGEACLRPFWPDS